MSRYQPYHSYKESNEEWLGTIPEHWEVKSLKSILQERKENNNPIKTTDILSLCMYRGVIPYSEKGSGGNKAKEDLTAYKLAYPDDIVVNSMNVIAGSVGLSKYFGAVSPVYYMLRPRNEDDRVEYFNAIFQSEAFQKSLFGLGNGILVKESESSGKLNTIRMRIPMEKLNTVQFPYPSADEQTAIANFLDRETAKIDTLIAKQNRMIELLNEKRSAIISHAVTKGLDPNAKMKDSGVEWLGEVPEHWIIHKLKYAVQKIGDIDHYMPNSVSFGKPYLMTGDMLEKASLIDFEGCKHISEDDYSKLSQKIKPNIGDLIFARYATIGTVCYVDIEKDFLVSYSCVTIKPDHKKIIGMYLFYFFKSSYFLEEIKSYINSNTQGNVGVESLYKIKLMLPPLEEQQAIIDHINIQTIKIDTLVKKAKKVVELLKERRTALISAAVTGKIDVRKIVE